MIGLFAASLLLAPPPGAPKVIDRICREKCLSLVIQSGNVNLVDQWLNRTVTLGKYAPQARNLVPTTEAPVRSLASRLGWRIAASAWLDRQQDAPRTHLRFFASDGSLKATAAALASLESLQVAELPAHDGELLAIDSWEEHAYNAEAQIWLLPAHGSPASILAMPGNFAGFLGQDPVRGLRMLRQTYDGLHAATKGTIEEVYLWDPKTSSLRLQTHPPAHAPIPPPESIPPGQARRPK